jgi:hypothetical protein
VTASGRLGFAGAIGAAVGLRLVFLFGFSGNYDTRSFEEVLAIRDRGGNVYGQTPRYNYSPVWWNCLRVARALGRAANVPLATSVGLLLLGVDLATAALLWRLAGTAAPGRGRWAAILFLWNPVSVFSSSWHGQFDNVAILFLLMALLAVRLGREGASILALGASLLVKHIAWFHPLLLAIRPGNRRRLATALIPYVIFAASFLPYAAAWREIRRNVFEYGALGGLYGTDVLLLLPGVPFWLPRAIFVAGSLMAVWLLRHVETSRASLLLFLVTLLLLPGIAQQYFVWPIALGALFPGIGYLAYTTAAALFFIGSSRGFAVDSPYLPGWYGPWWTALLWLLLEVRRLKLRPGAAAASVDG